MGLADAFHRYVSARANVRIAHVALHRGQYDLAIRSVRIAADKINNKLSKVQSDRIRNELLYLKCFCWTLLYFIERRGISIPWGEFEDLDRSLCAYVDPSAVSRRTRKVCPVDPRFMAPRI